MPDSDQQNLTPRDVPPPSLDASAESNHDGAHRAFPRSPLADVSGALRQPGGQGGSGVAQSPGVLGRVDGSGMPGPQGKQDRSSAPRLSTSEFLDMEQLRLETPAATSIATAGKPAGRRLSRSARKPAAIREAGLREESLSLCIG